MGNTENWLAKKRQEYADQEEKRQAAANKAEREKHRKSSGSEKGTKRAFEEVNKVDTSRIHDAGSAPTGPWTESIFGPVVRGSDDHKKLAERGECSSFLSGTRKIVKGKRRSTNNNRRLISKARTQRLIER